MKRSLAETFYRGDHTEILARTVDSPEGKFAVADSPYVIGALAFLGRLEEAELQYARVKGKLSGEAAVAARYALGMGNCRHSRYDVARRYFGENLRACRRLRSDKARFFACQGVAFNRYISCRYPGAVVAARKAMAAAVEGNFLFGKFLASDLIGHLMVLVGQISLGMKTLRDAARYARMLGDGGMHHAVTVTLAVYGAQFGLSPAEDLATLRALSKKIAAEDVYSQSTLLLEIGRQLALRGKLDESKEVLNEACRLIYGLRHRRYGVVLNLFYAYNQFLAGEPYHALNLVRGAAREFDPKVDRALELEVVGMELKLVEALGIEESRARLRDRVAALTQHTGKGVSLRMLRRAQGVSRTTVVAPGEDPLGDLMDLAREGGEAAVTAILKSGYLGLLAEALPLAPGEMSLFFDLAPGSLLVADRGNLEFRSQGVSPTIKALARALGEADERSKEWLIETVWGYKYHPARHDSLIYATVSRFRQLLGSRAHWIEATDKGYRLASRVRVRFAEVPARHALAVAAHPPIAEAERPSASGEKGPELNHRQLGILRALDEREFIDAKACQELFQVSAITATRDLSQLAKLALVRRLGKGRATRYARHPE